MTADLSASHLTPAFSLNATIILSSTNKKKDRNAETKPSEEYAGKKIEIILVMA
ncbi:hypothetical protein GBS0709_06440 [Edwardsiella tarda]|nr:hypothetical protein GBS0709_06440 [Edwardsiella tarda]GAC64547.1 hypothetical protein ET1_12_00710 [Edwardsiella tarda ATCC 15947 = NBRC 105688]